LALRLAHGRLKKGDQCEAATRTAGDKFMTELDLNADRLIQAYIDSMRGNSRASARPRWGMERGTGREDIFLRGRG
jgi:hypothetical protein